MQLGWQHAVVRGAIKPTEGLLLQVLNTAARHGLSGLAQEVFRTLKSAGSPLFDHHGEALVEALIMDDKINEAFTFVGYGELRSQLGENMTSASTYALRAWVARQANNIDKAWAHMEKLRRTAPAGSSVDTILLNAVVGGAIDLEDMQRAVGIYKEASTAFGCEPDVDTLNLLLSGCIRVSHRALADSLLSEFRGRETGKVEPNAETYELLIELCLTQSTYEDVFYHLEEMKGAGYKPTARLYELIIRRCYDAFDTRWKTALAEMKGAGYLPSPWVNNLMAERGNGKIHN